MRRSILILSLFGFILFGVAFALSFVKPILIERAAREVVRIEIERRVGEKIDHLSNSRVVNFARKALGKTDAELEGAKRELADGIPSKVASVVAAMLNANCECRRRLADYAVEAQQEQITSLGRVHEQLVGFIESAYASVAASLMREFRIFTASNATAFAILGAVTLARRKAGLQLALPAVVLVAAVGITAALYLFEQDWLHTILHSDYVGLGFVGYLGALATLLADIAFNRARVTTRIINLGVNVVGSALVVPPC